LIYYTLKGPQYKLEIHEDSLRLVKNSWFSLGREDNKITAWEIGQLALFEISVPKFMFFSGKIQWQTFDGDKGSFKFSTCPAMVKKIETYLQKRVLKNREEKFKGKNRPLKKRAIKYAA
jgi:hypothetical protein